MIQHYLKVFELDKEDAIRFIIEERNKAQNCKDLKLKQEMLTEIKALETSLELGNEKGSLGEGFRSVEVSAPSLKANMFDIAKSKKGKNR